MTDASGVPTNPDNIPTYNTSADAPSGLGFNTAMAQLQSIITNLKAGTLASGKILMAALNATGAPGNTNFLRGDGAWITSPTITTSTLAGGPPASPKDGDIWIATAVDANGTRWTFQFNAGSASASKWEFIGGVPSIAEVGAGSSETTTSTTYVALTTAGPSITVARAGDYIIDHGAMIAGPVSAGAGFQSLMSYDVGATGAVDADSVQVLNAVNQATVIFNSVARKRLKTGLSASTAIVSKYRSTSGTTSNFANRWLAVTPVRIT